MVKRKPVPRNASQTYLEDKASPEVKSASPSQERQPPNYNVHNGDVYGGFDPKPELSHLESAEYTPRPSAEIQSIPRKTANSFLNKEHTGVGAYDGSGASSEVWGYSENRPPPPSNAPPPPPIPSDNPPTIKFSDISLDEQRNNPWRPPLDEKPLPHHSTLPTLKPQDFKNAWNSDQASAGHPSSVRSKSSTLIDLPSRPESPAWDEEDGEETTPGRTTEDMVPAESVKREEQAWKDNERQVHQEETALLFERAAQEEFLKRQEDLQSGFQVQTPQESGVVYPDHTEPERLPPIVTEPPAAEAPPPFPPRPSTEQIATPLQTQPFIRTRNPSTTSIASPSTPGSVAKQQRKETYVIKKISWHDVNARQNPRISPILIQNSNGPCPLLALVNALTLSTPAVLETPLIESLRTREQISLGLLLDAVIDELISDRRGNPDMELPNVLDLHHFLLDLHTGMNVNPRYFPKRKAPTNLLDDSPEDLSHAQPNPQESPVLGTFEETKETQLYSTFSIPLIHGWLPKPDSPAYAALFRSAQSYEDVQNLQFREEELEEKLSAEGLSFEEQATLEDIYTIKAFLDESATQLTPYGLQAITQSMQPGSIAILFRNNHFSTLYRHPINRQLLQLVTDMGYAGHDEVVWESLADVSGENCEFFSGDFRLVGGTPSNTGQSEDPSWTTVSDRNNNRGSAGTQPYASSGNGYRAETSSQSVNQFEPLGSTGETSKNTEQEDHDLALALQLQEEEEERQRADIARRKRETELSQQYIEQQGVINTPARNIPVSNNRGAGSSSHRSRLSNSSTAEVRSNILPPRRNNVSFSTNAAPDPVVDPEAGVDAPPPSYEQAATQRPYNPPVNHPAHPSSSPTASRRSPSVYSTMSPSQTSVNTQRRASAIGGIGGPRIGEGSSRRTSQQQPPGHTQADKDCVVM